MNDEKQNFMAAIRYLIAEARQMDMPLVAARLSQILWLGKSKDSTAAETHLTPTDENTPSKE